MMRNATTWRIWTRMASGLAGCLLLLGLGGCSSLPATLQGDQLNERLLIPQKCMLMGEKTANTVCVATREAMVGRATKPGDAEALTCFDRLHESKLNDAKVVFNKALVKTPTNANLLACGQAIRSYDPAAK